MSGTQNCFCCHKNRHHMIISLLVLLVSSLSSQVTFMAEGRAVPKYTETSSSSSSSSSSTLSSEKKVVAEKNSKNEVMMRGEMMIGSRPPRCERRKCYSCGHCEAIQVPIGPQIHNHIIRSHFYEQSHTIAYSRGDDITNYKPMSWKCKCGNFIFNP